MASVRHAQRSCCSVATYVRNFHPCLKSSHVTQVRLHVKTGGGGNVPPIKSCEFLCGVKQDTPDPINPAVAMRWQRDPEDVNERNGIGSNCYYCERAWYDVCMEYDRDKNACQNVLKKEVSKLQEWRANRHKRIEGMKARKLKGGESAPRKRQDGVKHVAVKNKTSKDLCLIRPDDDFWPLQRYRTKFGDPHSAENRRLKHKICTIDNIKGVAVPGDNADQPFKLRRQTIQSHQIEKEEDVGSSDGDQEVAEAKFKSACDLQDTKYQSMVQGAYASVLAECALEPGVVAEKTKKIKKKKKKATKDTVATPKRYTFSSLQGSDDESDDDAASDDIAIGSKKTAARQTQRGNKKGAGVAVKTPDRALASGDRQAGVAGEAIVACDADIEGGGDDESRSKGRPSKNAQTIATQYWNHFGRGELDTHFYGDRSIVLRRLLNRWYTQGRTKSLNDDSEDLGVALKRLQVMELAISTVSNWRTKCSFDTGVSKFEADIALLRTVCSQEPCVEPKSSYLWNLYFDVHASRCLDNTMKIDVIDELRKSSLAKRYAAADGLDFIETTQSHVCRIWCTSACSNTSNAKQASAAIKKLCDSALRVECEDEFVPSVRHDASVWRRVVDPPPLASDKDALVALKDAYAQISSAERCSSTMLAAMHEFPSMGQQLTVGLKDTVSTFEEYATWHSSLTASPLFSEVVITIDTWEHDLEECARLVAAVEENGADAQGRAFASALLREKPDIVDTVKEISRDVVCSVVVKEGFAKALTEVFASATSKGDVDATQRSNVASRAVLLKDVTAFAKDILPDIYMVASTSLDFWARATFMGDIGRALSGEANHATLKAPILFMICYDVLRPCHILSISHAGLACSAAHCQARFIRVAWSI